MKWPCGRWGLCSALSEFVWDFQGQAPSQVSQSDVTRFPVATIPNFGETQVHFQVQRGRRI